jgi:hypothetical protein
MIARRTAYDTTGVDLGAATHTAWDCGASSPSSPADPENGAAQEPLDDPAALAAAVRALATRAHRALRAPPDAPCGADEIVEMRNRIDELKQQIVRLQRSHHLRLEDVGRWLDSLRCRVVDDLA